MSLVRPMNISISTRAKPTTVARSITRSETGRPRSFSTRAQKMWPPSSGRIGSRLIRPSERLTRASSSSDAVDAVVDRLVGDVADADDAGDLLALFLFEEAGEDRGGFLGDQPDRVAGVGRPPRRRRCSTVFAAVGEADQGPLGRLVVLGADRDRPHLRRRG